MSFPRYPEYKPSGNELLGEIPEEWDVWKLAHAFNQIGSGTTPKSDKPEYYDDGSIPWINTGDLEDGPLRDCSKRISEKATEDHSTLKLYPSGSLIFAMYGATIGKLGILEFPATVNQACCVFSGGSKITREFLFYWFLGLRQKILSLATGGGQPNVSQDILRTLRVACPEPDEQTAIAEFLDRETSKIDDLIAEQKRLIELLKEKRQAVISHAVTKGLNPDVPMKDSGVEWLEEIPEHWNVVQSRRMFRVRNEPALESDRQVTASQKYGIVYQSDFVVLEGRKVVETIMGTKTLRRVKPNDFVISLRSFQGGIEWSQIEGSITFHYVVLSPIKFVEVRFFSYLFKSIAYIQALRSTTNLIRDGQDLRFSHFVQVELPVIPPDEQSAIALYLDSEVSKIDKLASEAERSVELLQERRTALISAAVTGKIDVREFAYQETA